VLEQERNERADMAAIQNEILEGFRLINEAEERITIAKSGEGADKAEQIRENMAFIQEKMKTNRELIEKLRQQLRESSINGEELKKTIDGLVKQLDEKDRQIKQLRAEFQTELEAKNEHISQLDQQVTTLNNDVENLKVETTQKSETIKEQDKQLNTAYYVFGTKSELKEQGILDKGEVMKGNYNKNYFTKIEDIRLEKEIKLYSKSAKLMSSHPMGSYSLAPDATGQYVLRILYPDQFWSTSKYLVILVK
jgi:chromosome segregation ATPase